MLIRRARRCATAALTAAALALPLLSSTTALADPGNRLYLNEMAPGMSGWRAVTGTLDEWRVTSAETNHATIDTLAQSSGRYITPDPAVDLPESYEIRVRARIDAIGSSSSVPLTVLTDWKDTSGPTKSNLGAQVAGTASFSMQRPVATGLCRGGAPTLVPGEWFDLVVRRAAGIVAVYVEGQRVAAVDADPVGGSVGLGVYKSRTSIDSIGVYELDSVPDDHPRAATGCDWAPPPEPVADQPVLLNQSGFNTDRPKRFTAPKAEDGAGFEVVDATGAVVYTGTVVGGVGDFTELRPAQAGEYRVIVEGAAGSGESVPFGIGASWIERVSYENAVAFMAGTRCYFGDATATDVGWNTGRCRWSVMWRDGDTYSFEIPTLIDLYFANPSAFDDLRLEDEVYLGMKYEIAPDTPEVVRMIAWGVDRLLAANVNQTLWKEQLASFLAAYPSLSQWIPVEMYEDARDHLFPLWSDPRRDRFTSAYNYTPHTADLFQTYTQVGTGKGEFPPGHSIRANLDMYDVALRENRPDASAYLDAAVRNAEWIVENLDWNDPRTTKGQRMSEHVTVTGLVDLLTRRPGSAPAGLRDKVEEWGQVATERSDNQWDFRKYSEGRWTIPTFLGGSSEDPNETGNIAGLAAPAMAASTVVDDPVLSRRLKEIAVAAVDNIFGRNPTGRHASYRAPTEQWGFEGVEQGWYSEYQGGYGLLQGIPGVLDGSPKNIHYPYNPQAGNVGHNEGWVAFNTAWNASLAWLAHADISVAVLDAQGRPTDRLVLGSDATVELDAPLNLDATTLDDAAVQVSVDGGQPSSVHVVQTGQNTETFRGTISAAELGVEVGDQVAVSYGLGAFARSTTVRVTACPADASATVVLGDVDSGVSNLEDSSGCSIARRLLGDGTWKTHGAFVSHAEHEIQLMEREGLVTREQSMDLRRAAARSDVGR